MIIFIILGFGLLIYDAAREREFLRWRDNLMEQAKRESWERFKDKKRNQYDYQEKQRAEK